jgi:hypothetical protein
VPAVYRDAEHFFKTSYLTTGLKSLLNDVLLRLSGGEGSRVPVGGGKSHTLAALWHAAKNREALNVPEAAGLPKPSKPVNVAVFDGAFFDACEMLRNPVMLPESSRHVDLHGLQAVTPTQEKQLLDSGWRE